MDRWKFSAIAHRDHAHCNPIAEAKLARVLGLLDLAPGSRVLDVGCGRGELLLRLVEQYGVAAVGIDLSEPFLAVARAQAALRVPAADMTFALIDVAAFTAEAGRFDVATCLGGPARILAKLADWVRPGGQVLLGQSYWRREPAPAYLEALGATRDEMTDHAGNVQEGLAADLNYLYATVAGEDDWDHYEGLYSRSIERYAVERPDDPDLAAMLQRSRQWRETYLRWGRDTLGFGLYLFQKPPLAELDAPSRRS